MSRTQISMETEHVDLEAEVQFVECWILQLETLLVKTRWIIYLEKEGQKYQIRQKS